MASSSQKKEGDEEEEYVLIDLDWVSGQVQIPPNAPYVLSGLDTLNPILIIDNKLKLIGEYEETIGTCFVFGKNDSTPAVHEEREPKQTTAKQVNPIARLHKILKFRLMSEAEIEDSTTKQSNSL